MVLGLQDEIRRSEESRYDHRLHGVLLVAQGMTCPEVARLLGDAPRTVEYWVQRFEKEGLAGLREGERGGRPQAAERETADAANQRSSAQDAREAGSARQSMGRQNPGRLDRTAVRDQLGVRQCQRLFRQLGFRLRKPRPAIARADPERQQIHKKNSKR